ncbi:MAG TPA: sugar transferase [Arsenicitalea sp.]|nr:sugar transferase [Arsenicitalea sp.]
MLDIIGALFLLIFFLPFIILIPAAILMVDRGPIVFGHVRVGFQGRKFRCLKYRSMVVGSSDVLRALLEADPIAKAEWDAERKLRNDPRVTWLGQMLRISSLDELPQPINVLRGEMSLVGPRPVEESELRSNYAGGEVCCWLARPGLTGLWQVSGRSDCPYQQRVSLDLQYVSNWSLWLDIKILARTVIVMLGGRGSR